MNLKPSLGTSSTTNLFRLKTKKSSKGVSRQGTVFINKWPINFKHKGLTVALKSSAGRNKSGRKTLRTRGSITVKRTRVAINYTFRTKYISFVGGFFMTPLYNKLVSLVFLSSGSTTYLISSSEHTLFTLARMYGCCQKKAAKYTMLRNLHPSLLITQGFFLISQLPKNKPVSMLELIPAKGVQYMRSTGTHGTIVKMDLRLNTSIVKLPSGVRKVFSTNAIGAAGSVALPSHKKSKNPRGGFRKNFGFKPTVRGVAMNPVDHPHGGRTKAIKYPRTP